MTAWGVESGHIDVAVQRDVAVVTLRRPEKLNALTAGARTPPAKGTISPV